MRPPGNDGGRPPPGRSADAEHVVATTSTPVTSKTGGCCDSNGAWRRRCEAARRLPVLDCRCRTADPWLCRCTRPPLSDRWVDAGAAAARHILETGLLPLLEDAVLHALHARGGDDRALAQELYELVGGDGV